jgi:hypothetical protein
VTPPVATNDETTAQAPKNTEMLREIWHVLAELNGALDRLKLVLKD